MYETKGVSPYIAWLRFIGLGLGLGVGLGLGSGYNNFLEKAVRYPRGVREQCYCLMKSRCSFQVMSAMPQSSEGTLTA